MPMIGGDLGAMSALSGRFTSAGGTFQSQSQAIVRRVDQALQEFTTQMRTLDQEARTLAAEIDAEMKRLGVQAAATVWTGTNRGKADEVVAALDDDIVAIRTAVDDFVSEASAVVNGALTSTMTELQTNVGAAGTAAMNAASGFSSSVTAQQASFDRVMNG